MQKTGQIPSRDQMKLGKNGVMLNQYPDNYSVGMVNG